MSRHIVVSGIPGSGKSTLAKTLAGALDLTVIDKDDLLEARFEAEGVGDPRWRRRLSLAADQDFREKAAQSGGAILVSWWKHPGSEIDSGTPTGWLAALAGDLIEVHCSCPPSAAALRFILRTRHAGHLDSRWSYAELVSSFEQQAALGPLGISPGITVHTNGELALSALLGEIGLAFESSRREQRSP